MIKDIWLNLPVEDINKTKEFFSTIGFRLNEKFPANESSVSFLCGSKDFVVMFFSEETFTGFTQNELSDTTIGSEVLVSFDAESREEVEETAKKVKDAGGEIFAEPAEIQGWMYGFGFSDPDGHRWNQVFMDFSKMP